MQASQTKYPPKFIPLRVLCLLVLGIVLFTGMYLYQVLKLHGQVAFPLDDSWIHARVAANIAEGNGFSINKHAPSPVSTEPLWTLLLAVLYFFIRDPIISADLLGIILAALVCVYSFKLVFLLTQDNSAAIFAAVIPAFLPFLTWGTLAGMGVPLFVFLTLAGIYYHTLYRWDNGWRQFLPTLIIGLAALARPECFLLFGLSTLHYVINVLVQERRSLRSVMLNVMLHTAVFAVITSPFFLFNLITSGHVFPNTYYAKNIFWSKLNESRMTQEKGGKLFFGQWFSYFYHLFVEYGRSTGWLLLILLPLGIFHTHSVNRKEENLKFGFVPLAAFLLPLVLSAQNSSIFGGAHIYGPQARYFTNILVLWAILGAAGIAAIEMKNRWKYVKVSAVILVLLVLAWKQGKNSFVFAQNVKNVDEMDVAAAKWVDIHVPEEARIAVNDVGAMAYFSDREIIDVLGLVSPDAWPYLAKGQRGIFDYIKKTRPDYLVVFPGWFPLMVRQKEYFRPLHNISITDNTIIGSDLLVIYKCEFPGQEDFGKK